jgi:hypothetical protein
MVRKGTGGRELRSTISCGATEGRSGLVYEAPKVVDFGTIADHTFTTPGGNPKGCKENCHLDNFTEDSGTSPA